MITLQLDEIDAEAFKLFRQYQDKIALLIENQVFQIKNGSAEIHFTPQGDIGSIDLHAKVFRRVELTQRPVLVVKKVV